MNIETEEHHDLIAADRVEGTRIYSVDGDKMGTVESVMIEKRTGQVAHAVLSVGGFLGIGSDYHVMPWQKLEYDESLGGYRLNVREEQLRSAPTMGENETQRLSDRDYEDRVYAHYGAVPYYQNA